MHEESLQIAMDGLTQIESDDNLPKSVKIKVKSARDYLNNKDNVLNLRIDKSLEELESKFIISKSKPIVTVFKEEEKRFSTNKFWPDSCDLLVARLKNNSKAANRKLIELVLNKKRKG